MKEMTKRRLNYINLQLFAEGDDGDSAGEGDDPDEEDDDSDEGGDDAEEKKYTEKEFNDALKRRLARERRKLERQQGASGEGDGKADKTGDKDDSKLKDAEEKTSKLEMKIACYEAGVDKEAVEDVAAIARSYMANDENLDFEEAIEKVVKKYPQFKKSADKDSDEDDKRKSWGQRQKKGSDKRDGVEEAFLRKNPGLKI